MVVTIIMMAHHQAGTINIPMARSQMDTITTVLHMDPAHMMADTITGKSMRLTSVGLFHIQSHDQPPTAHPAHSRTVAFFILEYSV